MTQHVSGHTRYVVSNARTPSTDECQTPCGSFVQRSNASIHTHTRTPRNGNDSPSHMEPVQIVPQSHCSVAEQIPPIASKVHYALTFTPGSLWRKCWSKSKDLRTATIPDMCMVVCVFVAAHTALMAATGVNITVVL